MLILEPLVVLNLEPHVVLILEEEVMAVWIQKENEGIDFEAVARILSGAGLSNLDGKTQEVVFTRSYATAYVLDEGRVVGCARALSDGVCQSAIFNVALEDAYQGQQLGRGLIEALLEQVRGTNVILYTHPKTVAFYEKLGFRRQKTGFVYYDRDQSAEELSWLEDTGFLLPVGYRFQKDESFLYDSRGNLKEGYTDKPKPRAD